MDLISVFLIAIVAFFIGYSARGIALIAKMGSNPQHFINILEKIKAINEQAEKEETAKATGTELVIERVNETLYAYVKDTDQFIAQGPNLQELLEIAHSRFPGKVFFGNIPADNPAKELA